MSIFPVRLLLFTCKTGIYRQALYNCFFHTRPFRIKSLSLHTYWVEN